MGTRRREHLGGLRSEQTRQRSGEVMKLKQVVTSASAVWLLAPIALAQAEAGASASVGTTAAPTADASATAEPVAAPEPALDVDGDADTAVPLETTAAAEPPPAEPAPAAAPEKKSGELPYMKRYKPEKNTWEVGLFAGLFLPSAGINLFSPRLPYQAYNGAAFELGGRLAYFPLTFLGVEAEFMVADGNVPADLSNVDSRLTGNNAIFNAYRGHIVGQLPFWSIVPFAVVGVSAIGATSQPLGHAWDAAFHFGVGAKIPVTKDFSIRVDLRENMSGRSNDSYGGISFSEEVLVGGTFTFGRKSKAAPVEEPMPDRDGDTVPDHADACPDAAALTEDGCPTDLDQD